MSEETPLNYFESAVASFSDALDSAMKISMLTGGRRDGERIAWASWIFLRLCVIGMSLIELTKLKKQRAEDGVYTLDHNSVAALSRNLIEAGLMFHYLTEHGMTETEWELRRTVLILHDNTTRYRIFKSWHQEEAANFRHAVEQLREELSNRDDFKGFNEEKRERLLSGQAMYLDGLRSVVRKAGWDVGRFDFVYAYLSTHTHSSPVSFFRTHIHGIDFDSPSEHQYSLSGFALEHAAQSLGSASKRMLELYPDIVEGGPGWLDEIRRQGSPRGERE